MRRLQFIVLALILGTTIARASTSRPVEIRAVWVDRNSIPKTEQGIRQLVKDYDKAGINLLHPEVIFNGYSAYPSSYLPQKDLWNGVDMLGILIDEAHKHRMEVHPWVWVFRAGYTGDKGGILSRHPDWAMVDREGRDLADNSYWLNPCSPAVRRTLLGAYRELAEKYPIDGIQLDYIRFPSADYGYNEDCRAKFQAEYGIDPLDIQPFTKPVIDWHLWRENLVNDFVRDVSAELKAVRPGIQISAAVASYPDSARLSFFQNWEHWAANKWVEFLAPMDYTSSINDFANRVKSSSERIANRALLASGIGLLEQKGSDTMLAQIEVARKQPVQGVTLFASAYLDKERLNALADGPFKKKASLPMRQLIKSAKKLVRHSASDLSDKSDLSDAGSDLLAAKGLLDYQSYRLQETGFIPPSAPPIFIPDEVIPIPEAQVPETTSSPTIDGRLDDVSWQSAAKISLDYTALGYDASQPTEVYLAHDDSNLYVAYRCRERRLDSAKATITEHDGPVFDEDSVEVFLSSAEDGQDYYHFAMNKLGTKYDAQIYDTAYNPGWQGVAGKEADAWTAEIAIPFSALKANPSGVWRANFTRNRAVTPTVENMCWSPTYGSFHTAIRFGRLAFE